MVGVLSDLREQETGFVVPGPDQGWGHQPLQQIRRARGARLEAVLSQFLASGHSGSELAFSDFVATLIPSSVAEPDAKRAGQGEQDR